MPELGSHGSVRGARGNSRPYRESHLYAAKSTRLSLNGHEREFRPSASHSSFLSGRSISSYLGTWVLSNHDSRAAPQTVQTASPVCGTKNFSSERLYSAPQLHCTIVAIQVNMRFETVNFPVGG